MRCKGNLTFPPSLNRLPGRWRSGSIAKSRYRWRKSQTCRIGRYPPPNPCQDEEAVCFSLSLTCVASPCRAGIIRPRPQAGGAGRANSASLYRMALGRLHGDKKVGRRVTIVALRECGPIVEGAAVHWFCSRMRPICRTIAGSTLFFARTRRAVRRCRREFHHVRRRLVTPCSA